MRNAGEASFRGGLGGGGFGGGLGPRSKSFRDVLTSPSGQVIENVVALFRTLDWLSYQIEELSAGKKKRYGSAIDTLRKRLEWEFGDQSEGETAFNIDALDSEFSHLAMELDERAVFPPVTDAELDSWEEQLQRLVEEVSSSALEGAIRYLLLDVLATLLQAVRDMRLFGVAAAAERLDDALGRMVHLYQIGKDANSPAKGFWSRALDIFMKMSIVAEAGAKIIALHESVLAALGMREH